MPIVQGSRNRTGDRRPVMRAIAPPVGPRAQELKLPVNFPAVIAASFPQKRFDIRAHGAVADDRTDCTTAFAAAIDACHQSGGGRVVVPAGKWFTGPIRLLSNVQLHLSEGASVRFSSDPERYLPPVFARWNGMECANFSPLIHAIDCRNVAITGPGELRGQGTAWWPWSKHESRGGQALYKMVLDDVPPEQRDVANSPHRLRPPFIAFVRCVNVLLDEFTIAEAGPQWNIQAVYCQNVIARRLKVSTPQGPNTNGIVIDSSRDVLIEDCEFATNDDCISLKSGMNEDGWRVDRPTENVLIRRIRATAGGGGVAIGSEMSGGVRNVFVHDCDFTGLSAGLRIKAARGRGGVVEAVLFENIRLGSIHGDAIQMTTEYSSFVSPDGQPPTFRNICVRNLVCENAESAVRMIGLADSQLTDVCLRNVTINSAEGMNCVAGNQISLIDLRITPRHGPAISLKDSQDVLIHGLHNHIPDGVFLDLKGRHTRNIRLRGEPEMHARPAVVLGVDVPRDSIVQE